MLPLVVAADDDDDNALCSAADTRFETKLFVRQKEGAGQQKQQLARLAAAKAAAGGEISASATAGVLYSNYGGLYYKCILSPLTSTLHTR